MDGFGRFVLKQVRKFPGLLWRAMGEVEGIVALLAFVALLGNQWLGSDLLGWQKGIPPQWSIVPIALFLLYIWMRDHYESLSSILAIAQKAEEQAKAARMELATLKDSSPYRLEKAKERLHSIRNSGTSMPSGFPSDVVTYISNCRNWRKDAEAHIERIAGPSILHDFLCCVPEDEDPKPRTFMNQRTPIDEHALWKTSLPRYLAWVADAAKNLESSQVLQTFDPNAGIGGNPFDT